MGVVTSCSGSELPQKLEKKMLNLGIFLVLTFSPLTFGLTWDYANEEYWNSTKINFEYCHGVRQSPININSSDVRNLYLYDFLKFSNYDQDLSGKFTNNGHSLVFAPTYTTGQSIPSISCALMPPGTYQVAQYHFHWGSHERQGSENTIDGRAFPLEVHIVHYNNKYASLSAAIASNMPDALAVIGIFFQVGYATNEALTPVIAALDSNNVMTPSSAGSDQMSNLMKYLEEVGRDYYFFIGSLTTPPCNEIVSWFIMECAIQISTADMDKFRTKMKYTDGSPMVDNFRNVQLINNRIINRVYN